MFWMLLLGLACLTTIPIVWTINRAEELLQQRRERRGMTRRFD